MPSGSLPLEERAELSHVHRDPGIGVLAAWVCLGRLFWEAPDRG